MKPRHLLLGTLFFALMGNVFAAEGDCLRADSGLRRAGIQR